MIINNRQRRRHMPRVKYKRCEKQIPRNKLNQCGQYTKMLETKRIEKERDKDIQMKQE